MALNLERLMRAFFGLGDDVDFHCIDCLLVSGSYVNIQVSSQVMTGQIWFILNELQKARTQFLAAFFLFI
jgi:hypothetical protein